MRKIWNYLKKYIFEKTNKELQNFNFSNINGYELDINQRAAIIESNKNILVVAGAGSGKTLTILGKIKYLVEDKKINVNDILCISFTNETVKSLKEKCDYNIEVLTFHKLGLKILKENKIVYQIADVNILEYVVTEYFEGFILDSPYLKYVIDYFKYLLNNKDIDFKKIKTNYLEYFLSYKKLIIKFINMLKSNDYGIAEIKNNLNKHYYSYQDKCFFIIVLDIYCLYLEELNSSNKIDFDMMVSLATESILKVGLKKIYKYIIVDEIQDTSLVRYKLIKSIQEKCNCKLFLVGDDFQSIYKFSGCTLDLFVNFSKYFEDSKVFYLKNIYRNSEELIKISYKFIIKNPYQLSKRLKSSKHLTNPIKLIYYQDNDYKEKFFKLLQILKSRGVKEILVLGRCNHDINRVYDGVIKNGYLDYHDINVRFLTVHTSKGLESEEVIVLNVVDSILGFPNQLEDAKVLEKFFKNYEQYLYAEERRLFYVALTRTKNHVYLLSKRENESLFIKEIKKYIDVINV